MEQEVRSLLGQGKTARALRAAQRALAEAPGTPGRAYLHGLTLDGVGRHEEALEAYRAELAINPGHAAARARCEQLTAALTMPAATPLPTDQRSWHTSLPRPTLLSLQRSLHNYQYRGVPLLKNPFDLALYPTLLWKLKPLSIIEIGSKSGGSALWMGDLLNSFGIDGHVYSLDIVKVEAVSHPRVTFLEADGRALGETLRPEFLQRLPRPWLVIEDADHAYETSSAVLKFFDPWLQPQEYIVIEDGIISDLSEIADCNSGPHRALKEFLAQHRGEYDIDADYCDFFGYNLTWCTNGFLRKVSGASEPAGAHEALARAQRLLEAGQAAPAMALLMQIKGRQVPIRGADYLRACCFEREQRPTDALEALKEELRYFPDHSEAAALLQKLAAGQPGPALPADAEFRELFAVVRPYTMLSVERLFSLYTLAKEVCRQDLPGHFVECGVAGGGSSALLAAAAARYSSRPRQVYACDTFQGLPVPGLADRHEAQSAEALGWSTGTCAAPVDSLLEVCRKLGVEHLVEPVRGLFAETLPAVRGRIGPIALLHADGDWYDSTRDVLANLYDQVVYGGRLQIDDYGFWEGCRRAVEEFQIQRGLRFKINPIDGTGVWLEKPATAATLATARTPATAGGTGRLLNLGCGGHFHPDWVNVDFQTSVPGVMAHDLRTRLPFDDASCAVVYHSHVLEHLACQEALPFLRECHRLLAPGGILRVAVPDLETIARLYLDYLTRALTGDAEAKKRREWMTIELLDQMVREQGGGEMLRYWRQNPMPAEDFVLERVGQEARNALAVIRSPSAPPPPPASAPLDATVVGRFRQSGEVHKWMYDRLSLGELLQQAGFGEIRVCAANESRIPRFNSYLLDLTENGSTRKPDSLFMEAVKVTKS